VNQGVDDGLHALGADGGYEGIRIISGVANQGLAVGVLEELGRRDQLMALTLGERDVDGSTARVDEGMELCRKTSPRAAQSIAFDPPFPTTIPIQVP
jgi:hypothetical protein